MSEDLHPRADELDDLTAYELVALMHAEDHNAVSAIAPQLEQVAQAVEAIADRLRAGGRLHYFGAGTSGLIAAMDAAECPDTFGVGADIVQAHSATAAGDEDDRSLGQSTVTEARVGPRDAAVGISASGRTAFVLGALEEATARGALTVSITCNRLSRMSRGADIAIQVETGPEVIAGSTRLKSGTVQKLVLNMLSTGVFTRLAHTHRGRMVGVVASNAKLRGRAARMVADIAGVTLDEAAAVLDQAGGSAKLAIVMLRHDVSAEEARGRLEAAHGDLKSVLAETGRG
jgi:N-acetylmuramic acid 6-phosphate etherase